MKRKSMIIPISLTEMKTRYIFTPLCLLICLTALTDCSVKKRHYRNGYYISWNKKATGTAEATSATRKIATKPVRDIEPDRKIVLKHEEQVVASAAKSFPGGSVVYRKKIALFGDSCGDVILFRNGEELRVKVIEISPTTIRYRRCDNLNGPVFLTTKDKIFRITYVGGRSEVFELRNKPLSTSATPAMPVQKKDNGFAIAAFACTVLSVFIITAIVTAPLAFIFGVVALNQMDKEPKKYRGKWMALVGLVFGAIVILGAILILVANGII